MVNTKTSYKNYKFKKSAPTWNEGFEIPDGSNSVADIQEYYEYILKKHGEQTGKKTREKTDNSAIMIDLNQIESRTTFKINTRYHLKLLTPKKKKLLESTKYKIIKDENGEILSHFEITEVILLTRIIN